MSVTILAATQAALTEYQEAFENERTQGDRLESHGLTQDDFTEAAEAVEEKVWSAGLDPWDVFSLGVIAGLNAAVDDIPLDEE